MAVRSDCQSAVAEFADLAPNTRYGRAWAGLWMQVDGRAIRDVAFVKGHQVEPPHRSQAPADIEAYGNGLADRLAGQRAASGGPAPLALRLAERDAEQHRALACTVARRLVAREPLETAEAKAARGRGARMAVAARRSRAPLPPPIVHPVRPRLGGWRCTDCASP